MRRGPGALAGLRARLLLLLLLAALPALAIAGIGSWRLSHDVSRRAADRLIVQRDLVRSGFEGRLAALDGLLGGLAAALPPGRREGTTCADLLSAAARASGLTLHLLGPDGTARCDMPPPALANGSWLDALRAGEAGTAVAAGQGLVVGRRLDVQGAFDGALAASIPPPEVPSEGVSPLLIWVLDNAGGVWPLSDPARAMPPPPPSGDTQDWAGEGQDPAGPLRVASAALPHGLRLVVATPMAASRNETLDRSLRLLAAVLAAFALGGGAMLLAMGWVVRQPLQQLRDGVARWRSGSPPFAPGALDRMPEELRTLGESLEESARALAAREAELSAAMERSELLAAEIHHRVKNNLQIVNSLLALQASRIAEPAARAEFEAARDRIGALATLHRHMYVHHDPEAIDLAAFIQELGNQLFAAVGERPGRRVTLQVEAPALRLSSDQAVPLTLIITEAVSNALKHAFPGLRRGTINIRIEKLGDRARLEIRDDGIGPPDTPGQQGLGGMLLRGLARQLGGSLEQGGDAAGSRMVLDFPLKAPLPRAPVRPTAPPPGQPARSAPA